MVGTIGLAGSKARQQGILGQWIRRIALPHVAASVGAGGLLGVFAAFLGELVTMALGAPSKILVGGVLIAFAVADLLGVPAYYASRARQVPLSWKHTFPAPMSATLYGAALGVGVTSTAYFWMFHAFLAAVLLEADPALGLLAGAAFGFGRALIAVLGALVTNEDLLDKASAFFDPKTRSVHVMSAFPTAVTALWLMRSGVR